MDISEQDGDLYFSLLAFNNGFLLQFGRYNSKIRNTFIQIVPPVSFNQNNSYSISAIGIIENTTDGSASLKSKTATNTSFYVGTEGLYNLGFHWVAIGY